MGRQSIFTRDCPYIVVSAVRDKYSIQGLLTLKVIDTHASNLIKFRCVSFEALRPIWEGNMGSCYMGRQSIFTRCVLRAILL
jgi:hypothetical protein